jgi:hypothetical protein
VIWLVVFTVGLPVHILTLRSFVSDSQTLLIALKLYYISSYTSSIVAVVWVSVFKRKRFLEIIENISEVNNKIQYTLQEETNMNRKVMFNIISEIILLAVFQCTLISHNTYHVAGEPYYIIAIQTIGYVPDICNTIFLFQFLNLVFIVKQRYSHLNNLLNIWINGTGSKPICMKKENERYIRSHRTVDYVNRTPLYVSSVGNVEGTLKKTDIYSVRLIYSELYDITCVINDTYGVPILANMCWLLTGVLCSLYEGLISFEVVGIPDAVYTITYSVLFFKVTFLCHTATNEARLSRILVQKLLLGGNCRVEYVEELKMFSLQLQEMKIEYTAGGFFSLNLSLFASVVGVIASYTLFMVQMK